MASKRKALKIFAIISALIGLVAGVWYYFKKFGRDKFGGKVTQGDGAPWGNKYFRMIYNGTDSGGVGRGAQLLRGYWQIVGTDERPYYYNGSAWIQGAAPAA